MTRVKKLALDEMTPEQKALNDLIAGQRSTGEARGPFAVLMHAPDICERVADFVNHLLSDTRLSHRIKELAIISVARHYTAQYEWFIHARRAGNMGLEPEIIDAIRHRRLPEFPDSEGDLVYRIANAMAANGRIDDALYAEAEGQYNTEELVELISLIGLYIMIAVFLNSFTVEVPDPEFELLEE